MTRSLARLLACSLPLAALAAGCTDEPHDTDQVSQGLVQLAIDSVTPDLPIFERVQRRVPEDPTAQLNFEMRLINTGTEPLILDRATLAYTGAPTLSPVVQRDDLRSFYLFDTSRSGFGPERRGWLATNLPELASEEISDVKVSGSYVLTSVRGRRAETFPVGKLSVSRFTATKLVDHGQSLGWTTIVDFLGFEDRANALVLTPESDGVVVVGGAHAAQTSGDPYGQPWRFAAAMLDLEGKVVKRPNGTPWKITIPFPGCSAEAVDVERVTLLGGRTAYFLAGNASCGGDRRIAVALVDDLGNPLASFNGGAFTIDPGVQSAFAGGAAVDDATGDLYVVGKYGDALMVVNLDLAGALDPGFGAGGIATIRPPDYSAYAWEAKVLGDGRVALALEGFIDGIYQLGLARVHPTGAEDLSLAGTGWVFTSVPGFTHALGRDLEVHDNEKWFTVTGFVRVPGTRMAAVAFRSDGTLQPGFAASGFLVPDGPPSPAPGYRSDLGGDFITLGGGSSAILGATRFDRLDGTPDDPTVLSAGDTCGLFWPDTGVLPAGASHVFNAWDASALPTKATADLRLVPWLGGAATTLAWSSDLALWSDGGWSFPGTPPEAESYWHIGQSHHIENNHRRAAAFSTPLGHYVTPQRYAYDVGMWRWTGSGWSDLVAGTDGSENDDKVVYGREVHPIAAGEIVRCTSGVPENAAPGVKDVADDCNETGVPCLYKGGGNMFQIRHAGGEISFYAHLQNNLDAALCPFVNASGVVDPPIPVTRATVLGLVGNSGSSSGPHLHVEIATPWDALDPANEYGEHSDGRPLMFTDVSGVVDSTTLDQLPPLPPQYPVAAQWGGTLLLIGEAPEPPPPPPTTTCSDVEWWQNPGHEALEADGDAGPELYCPDEDGVVSVCVDNGNGTSDCQDCGPGTPYPGCPCSSDDQCGADLTCWGDTFASATGVGMPGRCYPDDDLPPWACAYDCEANLGDDAWCYHDFASLTGRARCMDALTTALELETCWENEMPAYDGECLVECWDDDDCHGGGELWADGWNYPSEYQCDFDGGVAVCRIP
jgi:hypothetical protein